ncbi:MAG TPA: toll/interleukin-1 receptor domain-containing protein [Nitrosospira sp.]
MKFLNSIEIPGRQQKRVELYRGDPTALEAAEAVDLLVISTFPDKYAPADNPLIGALSRKGLSIDALAMDKDVDLRENFSCWLSHELAPQDSGLRFRRILCFEQRVKGKPPEWVGDLFRALTPVLAERPDIKTLALPIPVPIPVAGDQGYPVTEMLMQLLDAAFHWLEAGLPLDCIKIVIQREAQSQEAIRVFSDWNDKYLTHPLRSPAMFSRSGADDSLPRRHDKAGKLKTGFGKYLDQLHGLIITVPPGDLPTEVPRQHYVDADYDVFISYSRANTNESEALEQALRASRPDIRIFVDRKEIDIGAAWQPEIFENLDKCRKVVALLSPDYLSSKMCKEEYNIAWIRSRENDEEIIFPVYLYTAALPTYMKYRNYFDCREGDRLKIVEASKTLLAALGP